MFGSKQIAITSSCVEIDKLARLGFQALGFAFVKSEFALPNGIINVAICVCNFRPCDLIFLVSMWWW